MNAESKITIHCSSLIGLKTELLRKQAEVEVAKAKQEQFNITNKTKSKDKSTNEKKKSKNVKVNSKSNKVEEIEDVKALQKSKLMLQAKSRLYDKLSKSRTNLNPNCLVDFRNKSIDSDHIEEENDKVDKEYDSDSEWIEYTDCFGRTRKCLKEDLPQMQEKDEIIREKIHDKLQNEDKSLCTENKYPNIEPEIQMMRKKWEEQDEKLSNKVNIHYEDILFDEARSHGVGYYAFSQDEEERIKQQESLLKLRKETEQKQAENKKINDIKDKLQQNRLNVAKLRRRIRAGLSTNETEEEINADNTKDLSKLETSLDSNNVINDTKINEGEEKEKINNSEQNNEIAIEQNKQETDKKNLENTENKIQAYEKLLGKRNNWYVMSQEEWVHKKRKERTEEFGPVYDDLKNGSKHKPDTGAITPTENNFINPMLNTGESSIDESVSLLSNNSCILNPSNNTQKEISHNTKDSKENDSITYQIEAGLKYLRKQFEDKHT